jgi:hypothetical protein
MWVKEGEFDLSNVNVHSRLKACILHLWVSSQFTPHYGIAHTSSGCPSPQSTVCWLVPALMQIQCLGSVDFIRPALDAINQARVCLCARQWRDQRHAALFQAKRAHNGCDLRAVSPIDPATRSGRALYREL